MVRRQEKSCCVRLDDSPDVEKAVAQISRPVENPTSQPVPTPGRIGAIPSEKKIPRNFNQTKLRGPLESTKPPEKEAKTKLSEAENSSEPRETTTRRVTPTISSIWTASKERKPRHLMPQCLRSVVIPVADVTGRKPGGLPERENQRREAIVIGSITGTRKGGARRKKAIFFKNEGKPTQKRRRISNLDKISHRSEPTEIPRGDAGGRAKSLCNHMVTTNFERPTKRSLHT